MLPRTAVLLAGAATVTAALRAPVARADPPAPNGPPRPASEDASAPSGREADAERRFREGEAAFDQGRVDDACAAFEDSQRIFPALGTLLNLGFCYEKQGKTASAWRAFTSAAAWASDDRQRQSDRHEFARQHAAALEHGLARLRIDTASGGPVALTIDGAAISDRDRALPLFVDPGPHVVGAAAPDHLRYEAKVEASAGATVAVAIPPLAPTLSTPSSSPSLAPREAGGSARRTAGWVLGAVGTASVIAGVALAADAIAGAGRLSGSCGGRCEGRGVQAAAAASLATFVVGIAGLAAGGWLVLGTSPPHGTPAHSAAALRIVPTAEARGVGVMASGAW